LSVDHPPFRPSNVVAASYNAVRVPRSPAFCDRAVVVNTSRSTSRAKLLSVVGVNRHMMRSKKG
jgi:hypothetical protein